MIEPTDLERAVMAYEAGETIRQLADRFGWSYTNMRRLLLRKGVHLRSPGPRARKFCSAQCVCECHGGAR